MTDVTSQLNLPADPAPADRTVLIPVPAAPAAPVVSTTVTASPSVPTVTVDAAGTPHVIIPLTKKTKAHVGAAVAAVFIAGQVATTYVLPASSVETHWIQAALGVIGAAATWAGIAIPTNLPISFGSNRKH